MSQPQKEALSSVTAWMEQRVITEVIKSGTEGPALDDLTHEWNRKGVDLPEDDSRIMVTRS